jgi:hypothetical protein
MIAVCRLYIVEAIPSGVMIMREALPGGKFCRKSKLAILEFLQIAFHDVKLNVGRLLRAVQDE